VRSRRRLFHVRMAISIVARAGHLVPQRWSVPARGTALTANNPGGHVICGMCGRLGSHGTACDGPVVAGPSATCAAAGRVTPAARGGGSFLPMRLAARPCPAPACPVALRPRQATPVTQADHSPLAAQGLCAQAMPATSVALAPPFSTLRRPDAWCAGDAPCADLRETSGAPAGHAGRSRKARSPASRGCTSRPGLSHRQECAPWNAREPRGARLRAWRA
jgi:hypothetical protein